MMKKLVSKYGPKAIGLGLNVLAVVAPRRAAVKTLDIFCSPRQGRVKSYQRKFLKKFETKVIACGEHKIMTYHRPGSGPRILLCHGWESNTFRWRKLYKELVEAGIDIVAMDAPGHGQTSGDKFTAVLYAEMMEAVAAAYEPDLLCGHSVGGMASIIALHSRLLPSVEKAIILASPDRLHDITTNYFNVIGGSKRLRRGYEAVIEQTFANPTSYYSAADFAKKLSLPALIVHDREDTVNKYEEGLRIHEAWTGSVLQSTEGLGHSLQAQQVYKWIVDFCEQR